MNTWIVGFDTDIAGTESTTYVLIEAESLDMAESGAMFMGRSWWPEVEEVDSDHRWVFSGGIVWFSSIVLLDDVENTILRGLKFLDVWFITGTPEWPLVRDRYETNWGDYTR